MRLHHFFVGSLDGSCSNFLPAFSFTIVSAALLRSCVRNPSVAPSTMVVRLPPPRRSLMHIRMKMPMTTMRRTRARTNVRRSFTIYSRTYATFSHQQGQNAKNSPNTAPIIWKTARFPDADVELTRKYALPLRSTHQVPHQPNSLILQVVV